MGGWLGGWVDDKPVPTLEVNDFSARGANTQETKEIVQQGLECCLRWWYWFKHIGMLAVTASHAYGGS